MPDEGDSMGTKPCPSSHGADMLGGRQTEDRKMHCICQVVKVLAGEVRG